MLFQVHALETAAIKPDPFNQYVSAGVVSGIATVSIGESCLVSCVICYVLCETKETPARGNRSGLSKKNASLSKDLGVYCAGFVCALCLLGNRVPETATLIKTRKRDTFKKGNFQSFLGRGYFLNIR